MFHICSPASSAACAPRCGAGRVVRQGAAAGGDAMLMTGMLLPAAAAPVRLEPNGKWLVEYGAEGCTLARSFGTAADTFVVAWRVMPVGNGAQMVISRRARDDGLRRAMATLSFSADKQQEVPFEAFSYGNQGMRRHHIDVQTEMFRDAVPNSVLTIRLSDGPMLQLSMPGLSKAWAAVSTCNANLLKDWGIDQASLARVATPAEAISRGNWITQEDYPRAAITNGQVGTTAMAWMIGADGKVTQCHIVVSSGTPALDNAACGAIMKRSRYLPARDAAGNPVPDMQSRRVVWLLGRTWQEDNAYIRYQERRRREWDAERRAAKSAAKP